MEPDKLLENIFTAYYDARKNKRNTINALRFEINYETKLFELYEDLINRKYEISKSICFVNFEPVQREIFAADFRDRIIHHLVFNYINPVFDKTFINDSYSCRKNKGTHYGIKRIRRFISQCSENYTKDCYIMKLDIEGYFMMMDRGILYDKIITTLGLKKEFLQDYDLTRYLLQKIIFNDPTNNCIIRGAKSDWNGLPENKSLFCMDENKGLPIGNLSSQLFGNIYLNDLDHFIKNDLGSKYYGRYVDDIMLIHREIDYLLECRERIKKYLMNKLQLILHPNKFYLQHYSKGVNFLGVYIKPFCVYIGKRCKTNIYKKLNNYYRVKNSDDKKIFRSQINSYLGIMRHYNTFNLRKKCLEIFKKNELSSLFYLDNGLNKVVIISNVSAKRAGTHEG